MPRDLTRQRWEVGKQSSGRKGTNWDTRDGCRTIKMMGVEEQMEEQMEEQVEEQMEEQEDVPK